MSQTTTDKINQGLSFLNEDGTSKFVFNEKEMIKSLSVHIPRKDLELQKSLLEALNYWFQIPNEIFNYLVEIEAHQLKSYYLFNNISYPIDFEKQNLNYNLSDAINGYYYSHLQALYVVQKFSSREVRRLYYNRNRSELIGRGMHLHWSTTSTFPTMEEYLNISTSWKFLDFNIQVMSSYSKFQVDLTKLCKTLMYLFRIDEEYKNLIYETTNEDGTYCGNITRGLYTFPIVHAVNHNSEHKNKVQRILRLNTQNIDVKKYLLNILGECESIDFTKNCIQYLANEALQEILKIGENPILKKIVTSYLD